MKSLMIRVMVAMAAIATIVSCGKDKDEGKYNDKKNPDIEITIKVEDITATTVKINISHDGSSSKRWLGFITDDVTADETTLITEHIAAGIDTKELHTSKQYVTIIEGLTPATSYKYIAIGYDTDGNTYGEAASTEFTTLQGSATGDGDGNTAGMVLNEAWTVTYVGSQTIENLNYEHVVTVDSRDNNSYAIALITEEQWTTESLRDMSEALVTDMVDYINYYNDTYDTAYTIADMLWTGDGIEAFDAYNLTTGEYRAVAIGINQNATLSSLYAVSEVIEITEGIPTGMYQAWLGDWVIVGMNNASCDVTISQDVANRTVTMTGWEGYDDLPITVEYDSNLDALLFYSQLVAEDYDLGGEYGKVDIYFFGSDDDGYFYDNNQGDYYIGICGILDDGGRAIVRYGVGVSDYPRFNMMSFMAYIDGEFLALTPEDKVPTYIAIMADPSEVASKQEHLPLKQGFKAFK